MPPSDAAPGARSATRRAPWTSNTGSFAITSTSSLRRRSLRTVSSISVRPVPRRSSALGNPSRLLTPPASTAALGDMPVLAVQAPAELLGDALRGAILPGGRVQGDLPGA